MKTRRSSKTEPAVADDAATAASEDAGEAPAAKKPRLDIPGLTAGSLGLSPYFMELDGDDANPGAKKERKSDPELAAIAKDTPLNPPKNLKAPVLHPAAQFVAGMGAGPFPSGSWAFPPPSFAPNFNLNNIRNMGTGMPGLNINNMNILGQMGNIPGNQRGFPLILPNAPLPVPNNNQQQAVGNGMKPPPPLSSWLQAQEGQPSEPAQQKPKAVNTPQPLDPFGRPHAPSLLGGMSPPPNIPPAPPQAAAASMNPSPNECQQFYLQQLSALAALHKRNPMLPSPTPPRRMGALDILTEAAGTAKPASLMPEGQPMKRIYIDEVARWDVMAGRGGGANKHEGNERFRMVIYEMKDNYRELKRQEKMELSRAVVDYIEQYGGRFIKYDNEKKKWFIMTKEAAVEKTSQALREIR